MRRDVFTVPAPGSAAAETSAKSDADPAVDEGDRALLEHMKRQGVDFTRPHRVDFIFAAEHEANLDRVCGELGARGYEVHVEGPGVAHDFPICRATRSLVVTLDVITRLRAEHSALASAFGAELDGWEMDPR